MFNFTRSLLPSAVHSWPQSQHELHIFLYIPWRRWWREMNTGVTGWTCCGRGHAHETVEDHWYTAQTLPACTPRLVWLWHSASHWTSWRESTSTGVSMQKVSTLTVCLSHLELSLVPRLSLHVNEKQWKVGGTWKRGYVELWVSISAVHAIPEKARHDWHDMIGITWLNLKWLGHC